MKCGRDEQTFFDNEKFDITLENNLFIKIIHRREGARAYTSLMNVPFWDFDDEPSKQGKGKKEG